MYFREHNLADETVKQTDFTNMIRASAQFLADRATAGLLTFNFEQILLQRLEADQVTLDAGWREFAPNPDDTVLDELSRPYQVRELLQPMLRVADLAELRSQCQPPGSASG